MAAIITSAPKNAFGTADKPNTHDCWQNEHSEMHTKCYWKQIAKRQDLDLIINHEIVYYENTFASLEYLE